MCLYESAVVKTVPTAPHSRVRHLFLTAPYIACLFRDFLETHIECDILETDAMVHTLSGIYVFGRKIDPDFWKDEVAIKLPADKEELITQLDLMRQVRGKYKGKRPWTYFRILWNQLTSDPLPSSNFRGRIAFEESEAETMVRIRLVDLVIRLVEAQIHPPAPPAPEPDVIKRRRIAARRKPQANGS